MTTIRISRSALLYADERRLRDALEHIRDASRLVAKARVYQKDTALDRLQTAYDGVATLYGYAAHHVLQPQDGPTVEVDLEDSEAKP